MSFLLYVWFTIISVFGLVGFAIVSNVLMSMKLLMADKSSWFFWKNIFVFCFFDNQWRTVSKLKYGRKSHDL